MRGAAAARILVVEDDPQIRRLCGRFLRAADYEIVEAEGGEEALRRLEEAFDVVLTDLEMPGVVNGNELTRRVRSRSNSDVIIMTGHPGLASALQAMRDGAYDYLSKPFDGETLRRSIGRCLDKRGLSKELAREKSLRAELDRAYDELSTMEHVRETFGHFVTPEVARFALGNPEAFSKEGRQQVLTVLFVDVRGFTPYSAQVSARATVAALNQVFAPVIAAVQAQGGIVNKFIGDGMMALFGAPAPLENHALAAARAALAAMKAIEALARSRAQEGLVPLRVGIGINTGEAVAGLLGTAERTEYSVIGDAVNVTSRLEGLAGPGQILVGPETARLLRPAFLVKDLGPVTIKGRLEQVRAAELLGAIPEAPAMGTG